MKGSSAGENPAGRPEKAFRTAVNVPLRDKREPEGNYRQQSRRYGKQFIRQEILQWVGFGRLVQLVAGAVIVRAVSKILEAFAVLKRVDLAAALRGVKFNGTLNVAREPDEELQAQDGKE